MTQTLANVLIIYYENTISSINDVCFPIGKMRRIKIILYKRGVDNGICSCIWEKFGEKFGVRFGSIDPWIKSFLVLSKDVTLRYWFRTPDSCKTKKEVLNALQLRVDRLKTFK